MNMLDRYTDRSDSQIQNRKNTYLENLCFAEFPFYYYCRKAKHQLRVASYELRIQSFELQVQIYKLRVQIHELGD